MKIFGKSLSEYLHFQRAILGLVLVVGIARLGLSLAGVSNDVVKWLSLTALAVVGVFYYAIRVHTTGFGSYRHMLPLLVNQNLLAGAIIIVGLVIAITTGQDNIFSAPEFSGGQDGKTWFHAVAHAVVAVVASAGLWLVGSLIHFITRKVTPGTAAATAA